MTSKEKAIRNGEKIFELFGYNVISKIIVGTYAWCYGIYAGFKNGIKSYKGGNLK